MPDDTAAKVRLQDALKDRDFRAACLIIDQLHNVLDLMEHQSLAVLEGMIDHIKELIKPATGSQARREIRLALIKYAEEQLKEQRVRERKLVCGITGNPDPHEK